MSITSIEKEYIIKALKFIDDNGVPSRNQSTQYDLVTGDGKKYPPKYVVAVAAHLANGSDILTDNYTSQEANRYLRSMNFTIEKKQLEKFQLTISADSVVSTDERFTIGNLGLGDNYKPIDAYFQKANGDVIKRSYDNGERRISNKTMPRIAFQVFDKQIAGMSDEEKANFPICQYTPDSDMIYGIYSSADEFKKNYHNSWEHLIYGYDNDKQFVIYSWNIFSTIIFVQECLKRFGKPEDKFILTYCEKEDDEKETENMDMKADGQKKAELQDPIYTNPFSYKLIESKNLIFRGAPGTGKSYLAKEIAADIISEGAFSDYTMLSDEQKQQVEFVQFHPSYDYSDFVEGLRPKVNEDGTMGFELQDGIFKKFVVRARKNYEDSQKSEEIIEQEVMVQDAMEAFFSDIEDGEHEFQTTKKSRFYITNRDEQYIYISIPKNESVNKIRLSINEIRSMLESGKSFDKASDITSFIRIKYTQQRFSYDLALYKEILKYKKNIAKSIAKTEEKKYVFIIDEINRGEISKIFGELFFAIDPGYRGRAGEISTQYSNLHSETDEKFYIPDNVYIIGTMNDIDRSVDSFDFAMRRRFRFIELKANERIEMLASLKNEELRAEVIKRMTALNKEIVNVEDLNENYQIGASYFLKLNNLNFDQLWTDYLQPLLQEYIHGMYNEKGIMDRFAEAYGYRKSIDGDTNETTPAKG